MASRLCGDSCSDATRSLTPRTWQRYLAEWKGCIVPVRRLDVPCAAPACLAAHRTAAHRRRRAWCHERSMSHTEHHTDGARYAPARVPVYRMARRLAVSRPLRTMPREARSKAARYPNSSKGPSDERGNPEIKWTFDITLPYRQRSRRLSRPVSSSGERKYCQTF